MASEDSPTQPRDFAAERTYLLAQKEAALDFAQKNNTQTCFGRAQTSRELKQLQESETWQFHARRNDPQLLHQVGLQWNPRTIFHKLYAKPHREWREQCAAALSALQATQEMNSFIEEAADPGEPANPIHERNRAWSKCGDLWRVSSYREYVGEEALERCETPKQHNQRYKYRQEKERLRFNKLLKKLNKDEEAAKVGKDNDDHTGEGKDDDKSAAEDNEEEIEDEEQESQAEDDGGADGSSAAQPMILG